MLSDAELERFSRQLILPGFELEMQERLRDASVLVLGCGGLGSSLALYLAGAGIGRLVLADGDGVEASNLHRQILHRSDALGVNKAVSASRTIKSHYPDCDLEVLDERLAGSALVNAVARVDLVADCSDNFPTRYALNRAAIATATPWVTAAAARLEGQLFSLDPGDSGGCYRCLYSVEGAEDALSCRDNGVLGPVVGVLGSLQALEVIKRLSGWGTSLVGQLLVLDLQSHTQTRLRVPRRIDCPDCAGDHD